MQRFSFGLARPRRLAIAIGAMSIAGVPILTSCSPSDSSKETSAAAAADGETNSASTVVHDFVVSRHTTAKLTDAEADIILAQATEILAKGDSPDDVPCPVKLLRNGPVATFTAGTGTIATQRQFDEVLAQPGSIHVVIAITYCGRPGAGIIGCAPVPGGDLAVVRYDVGIEGVLWVHEFGHNQGLSHRKGAVNVMHPYATPTSRGVNATECAAYMKPRGPGIGGSNAPVMESMDDGADVRTFVRRLYVDGMPYADASRFTQNDLPALAAILANPEDKPFWANAVGVMGAIGGAQASEMLVQFVQTNEDRNVDAETYRAGLSAMIGLGYAANKGDGRALTFLSTRARQLVAVSPPVADTLKLDAFSLNQTAVLGLSLTAKPQAEQLLQGLPDNFDVKRNALETSARVRQMGLQGLDRSR